MGQGLKQQVLKKKTYQLQQSQFVDNLFNQTQQMGGFPLTSYDLTDIGDV
jgi:hypothetical protein